MPKFGGPGRKKKRCIQRVCVLHFTSEISDTRSTGQNIPKDTVSQRESVKMNTLQRYSNEAVIKESVIYLLITVKKDCNFYLQGS